MLFKDLHIPESSSDSSDMDESYGEESNEDNEINENGNFYNLSNSFMNHYVEGVKL